MPFRRSAKKVSLILIVGSCVQFCFYKAFFEHGLTRYVSDHVQNVLCKPDVTLLN